VSNIRRPSDVAGVYGGAGAGAALVVGARAIILRNEKGAVLRLSGQQVGLIANADVSGLAVALRQVLLSRRAVAPSGSGHTILREEPTPQSDVPQRDTPSLGW
jgi:hypothetical protein